MATAKQNTEQTPETPQIYRLIGKAMGEIGAVGKDSVNQSQGFKYRGIDAVYNALSPVMAKYGLFLVPEILEQTREERSSVKSQWDKEQKKYVEKTTTLLWSILKIRFTMFAPDGSNVSAVVIGEGMDTGDKATNKAMSIALKYAAFQIFMIPTEETTIDPDAESHEVAPKNTEPPKPPKNTTAKNDNKPAEKPPENPEEPKADVSTVPTVPALQKAVDAASENPVLTFLAQERDQLAEVRQINAAENAALWKKQIEVLRGAKLIPSKALSAYTKDEAAAMVRLMYDRFDPTGTELKAAEA